MMRLHLETAFESLSRHNEELCGDKVEVIRDDNMVTVILTDGIGSGVKANLLATVTSRMISTMLSNSASIEEVVEAVACSLPVSEDGKNAYSTFSILQIQNNGSGYLVDFNNPSVFRIRKGIPQPVGTHYNVYCGKRVLEGRFDVKAGDMFIMTSDGILPSSIGSDSNRELHWSDFAEYVKRIYKHNITPHKISKLIVSAYDSLSTKKPDSDATAIAIKACKPSFLTILTGPPQDMTSDPLMVRSYLDREGRKAICGETAAGIVARESGRSLNCHPDFHSPGLRSTFELQGVNFCAPGTETLYEVIKLLEPCLSSDSKIQDFLRLDGKDSACRLSKLLLEDCTYIDFMVGTGEQPKPGFPSKKQMAETLADLLQAFDKETGIEYC